MKKYGFLVPVAAAVGALGPAAASVSGPQTSDSVTKTTVEDVTVRGSPRVSVPTSEDRVDSFVLKRSGEDGILLAQHDSHESHQSHVSHESHESHSSHDSHASHQSSTWMA